VLALFHNIPVLLLLFNRLSPFRDPFLIDLTNVHSPHWLSIRQALSPDLKRQVDAQRLAAQRKAAYAEQLKVRRRKHASPSFTSYLAN